jgi:hypothetical protein
VLESYLDVLYFHKWGVLLLGGKHEEQRRRCAGFNQGVRGSVDRDAHDMHRDLFESACV